MAKVYIGLMKLKLIKWKIFPSANLFSCKNVIQQ